MRKLIIFGVLALSLYSCKKEEIPPKPHPCIDGTCQSEFWVETLSNPSAYLGSDGYWRVEYIGLNYFTIRGQLSELNNPYIINGVPLIETNYDSDYWILFDTIQFSTPMYSYLGWFNDPSLNNPIPIGNHTYTLDYLVGLHPLMNAVGYQIPSGFCFDCPYAETLVGVHSKYTYKPSCNVILDDEMIGDTLNIFIETIFNSDLGERITKEKQLKIIVF